MHYDSINTPFELAASFVKNTNRSIFLTGKAGTGKTTFLKHIVESAVKNTVVAAPTGVAAINAGGVTLHSLFQLPFGPFIPGTKAGFTEQGIVDKHSLIEKIKFIQHKRELLQELELLIIDEVSMLRADTLDAIDTILRYVRKNPRLPFGGLQVLFIGDLHQLPPVVQQEEWTYLQEYYSGPFFFQSQVLRNNPPLCIELKKIYRQKEEDFINLLNNVRNNTMTAADWQKLESRTNTNYHIPDDCITLTTHNRKADALNAAGLAKLNSKSFYFKGTISKEFNENALPTEMELELKEGAHIMFIKNDVGESRRYFNGKRAIITKINEKEIFVKGVDDESEFKLEKETWRNIRYVLNKEDNAIEEEELGSFSQYPIRLAWGITIHKSQGLTFDKVVIDAAQSFSPGQVYVALSRCTTLDGITLLSKITPNAISTNKEVNEFMASEEAIPELEMLLKQEAQYHANIQLVKLFDWKPLVQALHSLKKNCDSKTIQSKELVMSFCNSLITTANNQADVADKFSEELKSRLLKDGPTNAVLHDRVSKGLKWFAENLHNELILPVHKEALQASTDLKQKTYVKFLLDTEAILWGKLSQLQNSSFDQIGLSAIGPLFKREDLPVIQVKKKNAIGSSQLETLNFFKNGSSIAAIAELRGLATSTIQGHLAAFVLNGDLDADKLIDSKKLKLLEEEILKLGPQSLTEYREALGKDVEFNELRIVINHLKYHKKFPTED